MYESLRQKMVAEWVIGAGITDPRVIAAMERVPRHRFVDSGLAHQAYSGSSLPIGFGQTISHPTTVAYMSQLLQISGGEKILEIGTGSGYQAAVLAAMGAKVFTIERVPELARRARALFEALGFYTLAVRTGDGSLGWSQHAPYDRIVVTAASPKIPGTLLRQLQDGGKLIIPVKDSGEVQLVVATREQEDVRISYQKFRNFVPLIGREGWDL